MLQKGDTIADPGGDLRIHMRVGALTTAVGSTKARVSSGFVALIASARPAASTLLAGRWEPRLMSCGIERCGCERRLGCTPAQGLANSQFTFTGVFPPARCAPESWKPVAEASSVTAAKAIGSCGKIWLGRKAPRILSLRKAGSKEEIITRNYGS